VAKVFFSSRLAVTIRKHINSVPLSTYLQLGGKGDALGWLDNPSTLAPKSTISEDPRTGIESPRAASLGRREPGPLEGPRAEAPPSGTSSGRGSASFAQQRIGGSRLHLGGYPHRFLRCRHPRCWPFDQSIPHDLLPCHLPRRRVQKRCCLGNRSAKVQSPQGTLPIVQKSPNLEFRDETGIDKSHKRDTGSLTHVPDGWLQTVLGVGFLERGSNSSVTRGGCPHSRE
jgi:hypothetical protein